MEQIPSAVLDRFLRCIADDPDNCLMFLRTEMSWLDFAVAHEAVRLELVRADMDRGDANYFFLTPKGHKQIGMTRPLDFWRRILRPIRLWARQRSRGPKLH